MSIKMVVVDGVIRGAVMGDVMIEIGAIGDIGSRYRDERYIDDRCYDVKITVLGLDAVRTDVLTICCASRCVRKMRCEKVWC